MIRSLGRSRIAARQDGAGRRALGAALIALLLLPASHVSAQSGDGIGALLDDVQKAIAAGDSDFYGTLFAPGLDRALVSRGMEGTLAPEVTRAVVRERDRAPLSGARAGEGHRLLVEIFVEQGSRGRISTHRLDVRRQPTAPGAEGDDEGVWRIVGFERLTSVDGLYRLALDRQKQFGARNLTITAEDLEIELPSGHVFVAEAESGVTALVLLGRGTMRFAPRPIAERGQVRIFAGSEVLETPFRDAFVRLNPGEFDAHVSRGSLSEECVDERTLDHALRVFQTEVGKSFTLDLQDLSRESWSLIPASGDLLAEIRTRKYKTLTYTRSAGEAEDISLFDREKRRNIAVYASVRKLEARGRFYNEDDLADYDVLQYDISTSFSPEREWLEGRARFRLRVRGAHLATINLRLNESLVVRAVTAEEFGRLLALRVKGQNSVIVSLPEALGRDATVTLSVVYGGRLPPQTPDREAAAVAGAPGVSSPQSRASLDAPQIAPEPRYVYSNRSWWYPQSPVTDYATASLRITVPAAYDVVASGDPSPQNPIAIGPSVSGDPARKAFVFVAGQPVRYLAVMITALTPTASATVALRAARTPGITQERDGTRTAGGDRTGADVGSGVFYDRLDLSVLANPRQAGRGRSFLDQASEILTFYVELLGDTPYPSFSLALVDSDLPGGHSPAYWAVLYQPLPTTPFTWRGDPVAFDSFPQFFLAHELAHQFWGQAVGWKNYHEQWISEGFAQYFAALYAQRFRGEEEFRDLMRQMRRSALERWDQGPIHLGYRLGHIKGDSRVFRALVYNKGAMVLHMLRRLVGDETFFRGLRAFYMSSRFRKVGTDDLRRAFEDVTGRDLGRFFQRWILETEVPTITFSYSIETVTRAAPAPTGTGAGGTANGQPAAEAVVRFEQAGEPFDLAMTVTAVYETGERQEVVVPITEKVVEQRLELSGPVRRIEANADHGAMARVERR